MKISLVLMIIKSLLTFLITEEKEESFSRIKNAYPSDEDIEKKFVELFSIETGEELTKLNLKSDFML